MNSSDIPQVHAIAYPISSLKSPTMDLSNENSLFLEHSSYASDAIEASGNFFSQLDSMIAAVKVESSALDTMRDKLKEVDNLRAQISAFNKRLIDADQSNLSLKSALMKAQESYSDLHKQKSEVESTNVQLRQELNRAKDLLAKEKAARQSAQQEIISLREKVGRYEAMIENLERDAKAVPVLQESNEILKNDLNSVRRKYKEEKAQMVKHMRTLESQQTNAEALKSEMRTMAMRLMDLANGTNSSATNNVANAFSTQGSVSMSMRNSHMAQNYSAGNYGGPIASGGSVASAIEFEADDDDFEDDGTYLGGDDSLDDDMSIPDQTSYNAVNSSTESLSKASGRSMNVQSNRAHSIPSGVVQQDLGVKKRKKKASSVSTLRQSFQQPQPANGNLSLPRIH